MYLSIPFSPLELDDDFAAEVLLLEPFESSNLDPSENE